MIMYTLIEVNTNELLRIYFVPKAKRQLCEHTSATADGKMVSVSDVIEVMRFTDDNGDTTVQHALKGHAQSTICLCFNF